MVLDHTLSVDFQGTGEAMTRNMELDIRRNEERYRFVKWAMQAYKGIRLFPPRRGHSASKSTWNSWPPASWWSTVFAIPIRWRWH